jgi:Bacterial PH domain/Short C-terminal domain
MSGKAPAGGWWQDARGKWHQGGQPVRSPTVQPPVAAGPDASARPSATEPSADHPSPAAASGRSRLDEITQQIAHLPGGQGFLGRREIKQLPAILWEDERVENIIRGFYAGGTGILIATNKRLVFIDKGLAKLRVEDFPYDKITSIQYNLGLAGGTLTIFASGNKADIQHVPKDQCKAFGDFVRARITSPTPHASVPASTTEARAGDPFGGDVLDKLERLGKLKAEGVLTEKEFQAQKRKILEE